MVAKVDGKPVVDFEDLRSRIAELGPGHTALLEVVRDGKRLELPAVLTERPPVERFDELKRLDPSAPATPTAPKAPAGGELRLGVQVKPGAAGLEIARIERDSVADRIGLEAGDVLRSINGVEVTDAADVPEAMRRDDERLSVDVVRDGSVITLSMRRAP